MNRCFGVWVFKCIGNLVDLNTYAPKHLFPQALQIRNALGHLGYDMAAFVFYEIVGDADFLRLLENSRNIQFTGAERYIIFR